MMVMIRVTICSRAVESSESIFDYYEGVHALTARSQLLELYAVDFVRVSGSPDSSTPPAAVTPSRGKGAAPATGEARVNLGDVWGLVPGAFAFASCLYQVARFAAGDRAAPHDDLVGDTRASCRASLRGADGSRLDKLGAARLFGSCGSRGHPRELTNCDRKG